MLQGPVSPRPLSVLYIGEIHGVITNGVLTLPHQLTHEDSGIVVW